MQVEKSENITDSFYIYYKNRMDRRRGITSIKFKLIIQMLVQTNILQHIA